MPIKRHNWVRYGNKDGIVKVEIEDQDGRTLDKFKWNISDKKAESKAFGVLKYRHNIFNKKRSTENFLDKDTEW